MDDIFVTIRNILIDDYSVEPDALTADSTLSGDLELDSIELVEFGMTLEETFGVEIPDDAVTASMTLGQVVEAVRQLKEAA